jgi:hypothetical protein
MTITFGPQATMESVSQYFSRATTRTRQIADVLDPRYPRRLAENVSVQQGLQVYFGVGFPVAPADVAFVERLHTVYAAMNSCLNSWATVYVEFLERGEHDPNEYAYVLPPVIFPTAQGLVDPTNVDSVQVGWADVQANIDTIRTTFSHGGRTFTPRTDLGFRINLNMNFRNADAELRVVTIIHELSHALAETVDEIGGVDFYADTVIQARTLLAQPGVGPANARTLADAWAWFVMDCILP